MTWYLLLCCEVNIFLCGVLFGMLFMSMSYLRKISKTNGVSIDEAAELHRHLLVGDDK